MSDQEGVAGRQPSTNREVIRGAKAAKNQPL